MAVNGAPLTDVRPGAWVVVRRSWKPGDRVRLRLDLRGRILRTSDGGRRYVAVMRGPIALARDLRLAAGEVDGPGLLDPPLFSLGWADEIVEMAFACGQVALCDYASAGNTWDQRSRFRTWMPA